MNLIRRLVLIALSIILALAMAETFMRNSWRFGISDYDLEMWRYAREIKKVSSDPRIGLEHRPWAEAKLMGVRVRTDALGFRRPAPETESLRTADGPSLLVMGDSVTLGWGTPEDETFSARLEKELRGWRVLNAGIGNTTMSMQVHHLEALLDLVKPKWIVFGITYFAAEPDPNLHPSLWVKNFALGLIAANAYRVAVSRASASPTDYYLGLYREGSGSWNRWVSVASELARIGKERSIPITVLLMPDWLEPYNQGPFRTVADRMSRVFEEDGIEVLDPSMSFPKGEVSRFWVQGTDPHPNSDAHAILAGALLKSKYFNGFRDAQLN